VSERRDSRLTWIFAACALLLVTGGSWLCASAPDPAATAAVEPTRLRVESLLLDEESLVPIAQVSGLLEPLRRVDLFAEEEGRVLEIGARELARVEAGQLLLRLDPLSAQIAVSRAEAAVERARSQGVLAGAQLERNQALAGRDAASRSALDEAENAARLAHAAALEAAADLQEARDRLAKKTLSAPFAGVLRSFPVEVGEYVRPGERVAEILDVNRLRVTIGLTDRQVVAAEKGARARLVIDALPGEIFEGEVVEVGGAIDLQSRKFPIRIEVANAEQRLLPGMVARVDLDLGELEHLLAVPREAVQSEFDLSYVWRIESGIETRVRKQRVQVREIPFRPADFEVVSGLAAGDRIATSPLLQLRDGLPVETVAP